MNITINNARLQFKTQDVNNLITEIIPNKVYASSSGSASNSGTPFAITNKFNVTAGTTYHASFDDMGGNESVAVKVFYWTADSFTTDIVTLPHDFTPEEGVVQMGFNISIGQTSTVGYTNLTQEQANTARFEVKTT